MKSEGKRGVGRPTNQERFTRLIRKALPKMPKEFFSTDIADVAGIKSQTASWYLRRMSDVEPISERNNNHRVKFRVVSDE